MNLNCKKSCGGCRENDVKYIEELAKKENFIRIRSHRMASIQSKNKLQLQVTYFITNFKQVNNKIAVEIIFGIVDFNFIPISTNATNVCTNARDTTRHCRQILSCSYGFDSFVM